MAINKRTWGKPEDEKSAWVVDYRHNGKRHIKTFEKKADAVSYDAQIKQEKRQGTFTADSKLIVSQLLEKWLADNKAEGLERSTIEQRAQYTRDYLNPHIGSLKVAQLTTPAVNALADKLRDATSLHPATRQRFLLPFGRPCSLLKTRAG
jgi:hypothetical protein